MTRATLPRGGWEKDRPLPTSGPEAEWLYHFSEEGNIASFVPRPVKNNPDSEPLVWAIDAAHAPLYFFPRDCPRIACWPLPISSEEDATWYHGQTDARMIVGMESGWLDRLRGCHLYRYTFRADGWRALQDHGCHVMPGTVVPTSVEPVGDLLDVLIAANIELRVMPNLWPAWEIWNKTTLHWSGIRLRNAQPPAPKL